MSRLSRRAFALTGFAAVGAAAVRPALAAVPVFYRSQGCMCCHVWTQRMAEYGYEVELRDTDDLAAMSEQFGIPPHLAGCHVGEMGGYVISGHVPPTDIERLLAERPKAHALLVPGMPVGSPGMEAEGPGDAYEVLLLQADGTTSVYAWYPES
jgi:hypothetical protein